jgi:7-carboxy-7-deazaguanine synthase
MPSTAKTETLRITEIYESIQGESTWAGERCIFVRLTGCNLRCSYCDTEYAFYGGKAAPLSEVLKRVLEIDCPMVEITGGEPLLQAAVLPLMISLCDAGRRVLLETSGNRDISAVDPRVHVIMDLKTPSSGECAKNRLENIESLAQKDEVKFVIGSEEDYLWARGMLREHDLGARCGAVLFSPVFGQIEPRLIVDWMVRDKLSARFQLQMHKFIWEPQKKGV